MSETSQLLPGFVPTADPVLELPPAAKMAALHAKNPRMLLQFLQEREERIRLREVDPYVHGYRPQIWNVVDDLLCRGRRVVLVDPVKDVPREILGGSEVYISGGNRSSKTEYAAYKVVRVLVEKAGARGWCFHTTGPSSVAMQQPRVYRYLPAAWKALKKHRTADMKYSEKNGFAGLTPSFVGPNGSHCWFKNYAQDIGTIEGEELDVAWMDELVPMAWIEAVRFRLATRNGLLIITFTPVEGYTATVKGLVDGATDILRVPAQELPLTDAAGKLLGYETVPRVQQGLPEDLKIVYFHIFDNPFGNPPEVVKRAKAKGREGVLMRCYGVPTKQIGAAFPTFRREVHVITRDVFAKHCKEGTDKMYVDPCNGRNWFMIWVRALADGRLVVHREWPSPQRYIRGVGDPGWWAEPDGEKADGKRGQAQKPWGFGLQRYAEEIWAEEGWTEEEIAAALEASLEPRLPRDRKPGRPMPEKIFERVMDSRFGATPTLAKGESKTLIESMQELGMYFEPAPGEHQREGIAQVTDLLFYDAEKPVGPDNRPQLLVTEECRNVIWALENWTGLDGPHGASKDPIDLLRYMALNPPEWVPEGAMQCRGGGAY